VTKVGRCLVLILLVLAVSLLGCSPPSQVAEEAYAQGYADGLAAAENTSESMQEAYEAGYKDGLIAATGETGGEHLCQRCYDLGFRAGQQS